MAKTKHRPIGVLTWASTLQRLADMEAKREKLFRRLQESRPSFYSFRAGGQWELKAKPEIPLVEMWAEVHWTQAAAEMIRAEEYAYISPEFDLDYRDPVTDDKIGGALLAIGLTNRPFLRGMAKIEEPDENNVSHVQVFATGEWSHQLYGKVTIEEHHLQEMIDNGPTVCNTMHPDSEHPDTELCVDYNHMSLWGGPDSSKAAGWVRGEGCYLVHPGEEEEGMEDEEIDQEMMRKKKKMPGKMATMTTPGATVHPENSPSAQGAITMKEDRIRELLKLSANIKITDAHRDQALDALDAALAAKETPAPALQTPPGSVLLSQAEAQTLKDQALQGSQALTALKERDARDAVREGLAAHKLTAAQAVLPTAEAPQGGWAYQYALKDPDGFKAFVAGAAVVVPKGRDGDPNDPQGGDETEKVKAFIADQRAKNISLADAQVAAIRQFGQPAFDGYRSANKAAA